MSLEDFKFNIRRYNQTELSGYVVLGSTGESVLLQSREMEAILAAVKEAAAPGKTLLAGSGAESTAETIERLQASGGDRLSRSAGQDALLLQSGVQTGRAHRPLSASGG